MADILTQLLQTGETPREGVVLVVARRGLRLNDTFASLFTDDSAEFNQVNVALLSIFKIEAKGQKTETHVNGTQDYHFCNSLSAS